MLENGPDLEGELRLRALTVAFEPALLFEIDDAIRTAIGAPLFARGNSCA